MNRTKFLLVLDGILFVSIVLLIEPRFAGLAIHEWLGLAIAPLIIVHLLYAWPWIAATLARLRARGAWRLRINTLLNVLLLVTFVVTVWSGVMTSFIALPALGIAPGDYASWQRVHNQWSVYLQIVAGLHIALNWNWIAGAVRRHVLARPTARGDEAVAALEAKP